MQLTATLKFIVIASYVIIQTCGWIWLGIKADLLLLDFNENIYNIGAVIVASLNTAIGGIIVYIGMKPPFEPQGE